MKFNESLLEQLHNSKIRLERYKTLVNQHYSYHLAVRFLQNKIKMLENELINNNYSHLVVEPTSSN